MGAEVRRDLRRGDPPSRGRRETARGDKWHLDEVVIAINGEKHWLWRAVDRNGVVLDVLVQRRRDARAAERLMRKLLKRQGRAPRVMVTDKLRSYGAAAKRLMPGVEHRQHKGLNNRAENSHQPTRHMKRFKSRRQAQRFLSVHGRIANHFRVPAQASANQRREFRTAAKAAWTGLTQSAA